MRKRNLVIRLFSRPRPLEVLNDLARSVAAVDAADATTGMGARAAEIEILDRRPVIRVAGHGPPAEELIEREVAMHDVAADQSVLLLHVMRAEHLAMLDGALQVAGEARIAVDDAIGIGLELVAMWFVRPARRDVLREAAHQVLVRRRQRVIDDGR